MSDVSLPLLSRFKAEVTDRGPTACLPRALPAEWLSVLLQANRNLVQGNDDLLGGLAIAAILILLEGQGRALATYMDDDQRLRQLFVEYGDELAMEAQYRATSKPYPAATLATLFSQPTLH